MISDTRKHDNAQLTTEITDKIALALREIRFGSVEIFIYNSKVVQIERREKLRVGEKYRYLQNNPIQ
jgi:hypothetical protein